VHCLVEFTIFENHLDDPVQDGEKFRYVSVTITGDGVEYLAKKQI